MESEEFATIDLLLLGKRMAPTGGSNASIRQLIRMTCVLPKQFLFFGQHGICSLLTVRYDDFLQQGLSCKNCNQTYVVEKINLQ